MSESDLSDAYRRAMRAQPPGDCPAPDSLAALVEGRVTEAERVRLLSHVMSCETCRSDFDLLDAIRVAGRVDRAARRRRLIGALSAAAVVTLAVGLWRPWSGSPQPVMRGGGAELSAIGPGGPVVPGRILLRWHSVPDAVRYQVRVTRPDGTLVAERSGADTVAAFDAPWTRTGGEFRWRVTAQRLDGTTVGSEVLTLVIRQP